MKGGTVKYEEVIVPSEDGIPYREYTYKWVGYEHGERVTSGYSVHEANILNMIENIWARNGLDVRSRGNAIFHSPAFI